MICHLLGWIQVHLWSKKIDVDLKISFLDWAEANLILNQNNA